MFMRALLLAAALGSMSGCATKIENPTDYITYRNEPLVRQVEEGMTKEQVQAIGGRPSSIVQRSVHPGSCNNYILNHEGHQQAYHVSFGAAGRVQHSGFMTCRQREDVERQRLD
ncbi:MULTISPECIES: osmotically-inducible lipoprotein OsmE [Pseudomonas]|jgi:osmotically inducible lipoprotein OsmE|uniref:osmotically-inducible lipoprotein OsmE n=1 Tax=Pseudomonas TaxID=286 RepID=UPI000DA926D4|nr:MULTISPECIES: osmotically-inducible lipoprotein OsmE [Pseudomonas]MDW3715957.1 osmotically-inducible lipoprotein OsmE [Pseudomonas sp. 2023EL-01195]PZE09530.1 osmotically-inducible lipoprotein OsmE [Pseudomonas sp. 57B-090624]